MVSSVTEGHIKKLRKAGYLASEIAHQLPEKGQLIPTPRPHERVVFLPHFFRGLRHGTICPSAGRRWAISFAKYPAARSSVMSSSVTEGTIHLP